MTERELLIQYLWQYVGTPYIWAGDDPSGFDCSGMIVEGCKAVGRLEHNEDLTADGLRMRFQKVIEPKPADLVFWLRDGKAYHVGLVIDPVKFYIGADGGGSATQTIQDAWRQNAFVKIRPVGFRTSPRVYAALWHD